jgi:hypothetical protein
MMIPGVSICSIGQARGHGLEIDPTLLSQLQSEIARRGRVPCKLNHRGGLETVIGWIENARLGAGKLIGDLELCKSSPSYNFVRELVTKFSGSFGLSPAFTGAAEPLPDGNTAARCRELFSIDLVESPASNPTGLFEARFNGSVIEFSARPAVLTLSAKERAELTALRRRVGTLQLRFDTTQKRGRFVDDDDETQGHDGRTNVVHDAITGALEGGASAVVIDALLHGEGTIAERLAGVGRSLKTPIESGLPKKALIGGLAGGVLTAGAGLLVSKLASDHRKKQQQRRGFVGTIPETTQLDERKRYTAQGSHLIGGAKIGAGVGAVATGGTTAAVIAVLDKLRKAERKVMARDALIAGASGALRGGAKGALAGALIGGAIRKRERREFARLSPAEQRDRSLYRVAGYKNRISEDELNRAASNYTKAGATGALAGGLIGSLKSKAKIGAGIGALAGIASIKAIRAASPPDPFGQHTPEEKAAEKAVPIAAGIVAAIAAKKKLSQAAERAAKGIGRNLARSGRLFE